MTAEMHAKGAHHPEVVKLLRGDAKKQKEKEGGLRRLNPRNPPTRHLTQTARC